MEKRNLKRAIAKFEELAADDEYEGNRKIINLDAFLKGDLKKKKRKNPDHLESTPIKSSRNERPEQLSNSFDDPSDESSVEIKTADQFLKRFLSQPPLPTEDKMKKKPTANKSTSKSTVSTKSTASNKSTASTKSSTSSAAKRPVSSKQSTKSAASKSMITSRPSISKPTSSNRTDDRSLASKSLTSKSLNSKSLESKSFGNRSTKSTANQSTTSRMAQLSRSKERVQKDGDLKLKEREKQFLLMLQNRNSALDDEEYDEEDDEEYDEENDEEHDDEEEPFDEELDDESAEESSEDETLDDESIDPESSELIDEHRLKQLREQQEFDDESIGDDHQQLAQEEMADEESEPEALRYPKVNRPHQQSTSKLHGGQRRQSGLVKFDPVAKQQAVSQAVCKVTGKSSQSPWDYENPARYVTNFEYQQSATEELYGLVMQAEEYSFNILTKLIKNIKQTLDQDELPEPSRVKPFFHFTPDNQIHVTFLFVNPNEVYYTPWNNIISSNYSYLSSLFTKIYDIIFSFNIGLMKKGVHIRA